MHALESPASKLLNDESWWTIESTSNPAIELDYHLEYLRWFTVCLDAGPYVDIVPVTGD